MSPLKKTLYATAAVALVAFPTTVTAAVAKDKDDKPVPPGHAKKAEESGGAPFVPPGQAKKAEPTDNGAPFVPPGQAKKDEKETPPGQAKKAEKDTPRGQAKKDQPSESGSPSQADGDAGTAPVVAPAAPPKLGRSVGVRPLEGTVRVRGAKGGEYVPLGAAASIPAGAIVDARKGTLVLRTAVGRSGRTQSIELTGAIFQVRQPRRGRGMTEFRVRGGRPEGCPARRGNARIAAVGRKKAKRSRGLWAKDRNGRFRTRGRNSVATVRGTRWLTRETCAGTLTRVTEGAVSVRDRRSGKTVLVRAGQSYLARTRG